MSTKYPFPSHVSVQSFVTVKLGDKRVYGLWKTQMLRLLESHDMLGFINQSSPAAPHVMQVGDDEHKLWNRSDALVYGWIVASLSEKAAITVLNRLKSKLQQTHFTAKQIWDQVQSMYGQQADEKEERKGGCVSPCIDLRNKVQEDRENSRNKQELYDAVERGKLKEVMSILEKKKVGITESIGINGNTALHIAVAYRDDGEEFLNSLLDLNNHNIPLKDIQNSDGSTLLHLAFSLGNTNAGKILLKRSPDLLHAKDNQGCTPLHIILSRPWNKEMCLFFLESEIFPDIEQQANTEPLVNAISYRHFDLALTFVQRCNSLKSPAAVLMAVAQNCPVDFTPNQLIIYELLRTPVLHFITRGTSGTKACTKLANLVLRAVLAYPYKMLIRICMKLQLFKDLKESMKEREDAREFLDAVCALIRFSQEVCSYRDFYTEAMLEAIRRDASDVVEIIVHWFPEAALIVDEDGHNFAQAAWKNRASKVYALILDENLAKHTSLSQESVSEESGNNFLHFAARLGPSKKLDLIPCPPLRMQHELQWFKVAQEIVPQGHMEKNCLGETPEMVFKKEHKDLEIECGNWIKGVGNSVAIGATLIITVMVAAALQVSSGDDDSGFPDSISQAAFILFEVLTTISAASSALCLFLTLAILTSPLIQDDFLLRLPLTMVIGIVSLFLSVAFGALALGVGIFLLFGADDLWIFCMVAPLIAIPTSLFLLFYLWYVSHALAHFMHSTGSFFIIHGLRRLKLVGRIFI